jgi:NADH-quinone oxidoreductase subunit N
MRGAEFTAILPFLVLAATIVAVMLAIAVRRRHALAFGLSLAGTVLSFAALLPAGNIAPRHVTPLFVIDGYALFYMGLILAATAAVLALSYGYLEKRRGPQEEYYLLILLATLGAMALVASDHFASFFVGLETLSISLLGLIAYPRDRERPVEAGIKYLILAGVSSAILLFGMALVYARLGTLSFGRIAVLLHRIAEAPPDIYWLTGLAMIVAGIGFKLSLVPFHMWAPDVYEGAPAPVTGFIAVVSKGAVFALLLRYYSEAGAYGFPSALVMINVLAIASILIGNLLALLQSNVKRILAYSSIAHLGYLLVAFLAGGALAVEAVTYYLVAYFVMTLGAFGIVTVLSEAGGEADLDDLEGYRALLWRRSWLGGAFTAMLLSLAGIPLTVGFMAKFYAVQAGIGAAMWPAVFALVVGSVIGLFYYLRIIVVMSSPVAEAAPPDRSVVPLAGGSALVALMLLLIWLGVYPSPIISLIRATALHVAIR